MYVAISSELQTAWPVNLHVHVIVLSASAQPPSPSFWPKWLDQWCRVLGTQPSVVDDRASHICQTVMGMSNAGSVTVHVRATWASLSHEKLGELCDVRSPATRVQGTYFHSVRSNHSERSVTANDEELYVSHSVTIVLTLVVLHIVLLQQQQAHLRKCPSEFTLFSIQCAPSSTPAAPSSWTVSPERLAWSIVHSASTLGSFMIACS